MLQVKMNLFFNFCMWFAVWTLKWCLFKLICVVTLLSDVIFCICWMIKTGVNIPEYHRNVDEHFKCESGRNHLKCLSNTLATITAPPHRDSDFWKYTGKYISLFFTTSKNIVTVSVCRDHNIIFSLSAYNNIRKSHGGAKLGCFQDNIIIII